MNLNKIEKGVYETEDGRFRVEKDRHLFDCLDEHPVRISAADQQACRDAMVREATGGRPARWDFCPEVIRAIFNGEKGYMCPGGVDHERWHWQVWDNERDDYAPGGEDFDTKKDAVKWLEAHIEREAYLHGDYSFRTVPA